MTYACKTMKTPVGELKLVASDRGLAAVLWENDPPGRVRLAPLVENPAHPVLLETERQLSEYFAGSRTTFSLVFDPVGTDFQKSVWSALSTIPFGETRSYAQIARQVGRPKAVRAVGAANGKNPLSIVVPCHRVIGTNGKLTGFAGGLEVKGWLLNFEQGVSASNALQKRGSKFAMKNGIPVLPSTGEVVSMDRVRQIMEEEGV